MFRGLFKNSNAILAGAGAAAKTAADTSWAWAGYSMGTAGETEGSKYGWSTVMVFLAVTLAAVGGAGVDKVKKMVDDKSSFFCSSLLNKNFYKRNAFTLIGGGLGMAYAFISNYFAFTDTTTPGNELPEEAKKVLYMLGEVLGSMILAGEVGKVVDLLRQLEKKLSHDMQLSDVYDHFESQSRSGGDNFFVPPSLTQTLTPAINSTQTSTPSNRG